MRSGRKRGEVQESGFFKILEGSSEFLEVKVGKICLALHAQRSRVGAHAFANSTHYGARTVSINLKDTYADVCHAQE